MLKSTLRTAILTGGLLIPATAMAVPAIVTSDLNMRTGPGTQYQRLSTVPDGNRVEVQSCLRGYNWCQVHWAGRNGWVSGNYLAYLERGRRAPLPSIGFSIGIPIIQHDRDDWRDRDRRDRDDWRDRRDWDDRRGRRDRDEWREGRGRDEWRDRRGRDDRRGRGPWWRDRGGPPPWRERG